MAPRVGNKIYRSLVFVRKSAFDIAEFSKGVYNDGTGRVFKKIINLKNKYMKTSNEASAFFVVAVAFLFGLAGVATVQAATAPDMGVAVGYSVFGAAGITETAAQTSHLWGVRAITASVTPVLSLHKWMGR